jgi:hypothetical protein
VLPRLPATTICFILFQVLQLLRVLLSKPPASPSSNPGPLTAVYSSTPRRRTKNSQSRPSRLSWFSFASSIRGQQKHAARHSTKRRYLLLMRRSEALRAIEIAARHRAGGNLQSLLSGARNLSERIVRVSERLVSESISYFEVTCLLAHTTCLCVEECCF